MTDNDVERGTPEELAAFIVEQENRLRRSSFDIPDEHLREFQAVFGLCAQAIRFAGSYVALARAGYPREAVALARQALEHAVTAHWAHYADRGVDRLLATLELSNRDFYTKMGTWLDRKDVLAEIDARAEALGDTGKGMPKPTDRFRELDTSPFLETMYMQLSQFVHVTGTSALGFLSAEGEGVTLHAAAGDPYADTTLRTTAMSAMFAAWLLEILTKDQAGLPRLDEQSIALFLPWSARDPAPPEKS